MTTAPALDERALRRPEFREGVVITLWDGQGWTFPRPVLESFRHVRGADGRTRLAGIRDVGVEFDDLVDRYVDADGGAEEAVALFDVAFYLLSLNYNLSIEDTRHILRRAAVGSADSVRSMDMWSAISDLALGNDRPKP